MSSLSDNSLYQEVLSADFFKIATPQGADHAEAVRILGFTKLANQLTSDDARRHTDIQQYFPYCLSGEDASNFLDTIIGKITKQVSDNVEDDIDVGVARNLAQNPERVKLFDSISLWRYQRQVYGVLREELALVGKITTNGKDIEYVLARWGVGMPGTTALGDIRRSAEQAARDDEERSERLNIVQRYEQNRRIKRSRTFGKVSKYWILPGIVVTAATVLVSTVVLTVTTIWQIAVIIVAAVVFGTLTMLSVARFHKGLSVDDPPSNPPTVEAYKQAKRALKK